MRAQIVKVEEKLSKKDASKGAKKDKGIFKSTEKSFRGIARNAAMQDSTRRQDHKENI